MLLAMNKTAQNTTSSLIAGSPAEIEAIDPATTLPPAEVSGLNAADLQAINDDRLAAVRQAIDNGDYDSDAYGKFRTVDAAATRRAPAALQSSL